MRRISALFAALAVLGLAAWLAVDIVEDVRIRKQIADRTRQLPVLDLLHITERPHEQPARPTVLLFFHTRCSYCRREIEDMIDNAGLFTGTNVLFISSEHPDTLRYFSRAVGLNASGFTVGTDTSGTLGAFFGVRRIPASFVYDAAGMLVESFTGLTRAGVLADAATAVGEARSR